MKVLALLFVGLFSTSLFAKTVTKRRIDDLERRVALLEQKIERLVGNLNKEDPTSELRKNETSPKLNIQKK